MKCYIVGNGKSLVPEQLDKIVGRPSYACNRINLIYPKTEWRPTVYAHPESFAPDTPFIQENVDAGITCWVGEHFTDVTGNFRPIKDCHHHLFHFDSPEVPDEWHFPQPCTFGGSVNWMMQRAVLDGFDELILLGCDLEYRDKKPSHFDNAYEHGREQPAFYAGRDALYGHIQAMNYIRRRNLNVRVFNGTRGGLLEVWPRVSL